MNKPREDRRLVAELMKVLKIRIKGNGMLICNIMDGDFVNAEVRAFGLVGHETPVDNTPPAVQT